MAYRLLITRGRQEGQQFVVVQPEFTLGREGADLALSDSGVSGRHARLVATATKVSIEDLGSSNGTQVNGVRISAPRFLVPGDAIAVGTALLTFLEAESPAKRSSGASSRSVAGEVSEPPLPKRGSGAVQSADDASEQLTSIGRPFAEVITQPVRPAAKRPNAFADANDRTEEAQALRREAPEDSTDSGVPLGALGLEVTHTGHPVVPSPAPSAGPASRKVPVAAARPMISAPLTALPQPRPSTVVPVAQVAAVPGEPEATRIAVKNPFAIVEPTRAVVVPAPQAQATAMVASPVGGALARGAEPASAAERYRRRREVGNTLGAQLGLLWSELSAQARTALAGAAFGLVAVVGVGLYQFFKPPEGPVLPPEPDSIGFLDRVGNSFGCGPGVDYVDCDQKVFSFELRTPTAAALFVRFQALDIAADTVRVSLNGNDLAAVPADIGIPDREIELLAAPQLLKRDQRNSLTFDNVKNPPGSLPWQVRNVGIELVPVPEMTPTEALSRASELLKQGEHLYKTRAAGPDNVFAAWRKFREAWILLLGQSDAAPQALTVEVKRRADTLRDELDRQCGQLLLDARKQIELKNPDRAREILEEVPQYFPTPEHRCHNLARERLVEYQEQL